MGGKVARGHAVVLEAELHLQAAACSGCRIAGQTLTIEITRLEAEVERLRKEIRDDDPLIDELRCAGAKLEAEIERLRKQVGQFKTELTWLETHFDEQYRTHPTLLQTALRQIRDQPEELMGT